MPPVPRKPATDKQIGQYTLALYDGLSACKASVDTYLKFRRATGGMPQ